MRAEEFVRSIYLGDRACLSIMYNSSNKTVRIEIDLISRIRDKSGLWNYYNAENIENGFIVFKEVESFSFTPNGTNPNDYIELNEVRVVDTKQSSYFFRYLIGSVDDAGNTLDCVMEVVAGGVSVEDSFHATIEESKG